MTQNENRRGARRQPRGLQRQAEILDAAGAVFSEMGYEEATTNAIAARAGISPGSLYQFFPNKAAIGNALAQRYKDEFDSLWKNASTLEIIMLPLPALVDHVIDSLVSFTLQRSGFLALFLGADISPQVAAIGFELHASVIAFFGTLIAARAPSLPPERCELIAEVIMKIYKAFVPSTLDSNIEYGQRLMEEMKAVLRGYLTLALESH